MMLTTEKEIHQWLKSMDIEDYFIRHNLIVDVHSSVFLQRKELKELPVQFGVIEGGFDCSNNQLTSMKGCPIEVNGYFNCENNQISSLEYAPKHVTGDFMIEGNLLICSPLDFLNLQIDSGLWFGPVEHPLFSNFEHYGNDRFFIPFNDFTKSLLSIKNAQNLSTKLEKNLPHQQIETHQPKI